MSGPHFESVYLFPVISLICAPIFCPHAESEFVLLFPCHHSESDRIPISCPYSDCVPIFCPHVESEWVLFFSVTTLSLIVYLFPVLTLCTYFLSSCWVWNESFIFLSPLWVWSCTYFLSSLWLWTYFFSPRWISINFLSSVSLCANWCFLFSLCTYFLSSLCVPISCPNNNNNSECISKAPFHVKHAQLCWTDANTKYMQLHIRHPKQHVSKQSWSNIQLSSKDLLPTPYPIPQFFQL